MLVREGAARSLAADSRLAFSLAGIAGALNAAGFYAVGLYSSNMTGNVTAIADHLALRDARAASVFAGVVLCFAAGAGLAAVLVNAGRRRRLRGVYALAILAEAALLLLLGAGELRLPGLLHGPPGAAALAFALGLQNATVTRLSDARVRTTHVTGMLTDLGIELGNLLEPALRCDRGNRERLLLHALTVLAFAAGGVAGVVLFRGIGAWLLVLAAALLTALALPGAWRERKKALLF